MRLTKGFCLFALLLTFVLGAQNPLSGADLHVIAVGDLAADDLRSSIEIDLERVQGFAGKISAYTGMNLYYYLYEGSDGEPEQLMENIQQLSTNDDDVILFYYSGHGYRPASKDKSPWPNLYFSRARKGLELDWVIQKLKKKSAHLVIVIADSCNNILSDFLAPPLAKAISYSEEKAFVSVKNNYSKLFLETNGFIVATSSKEGQVSYSVNQYGSLFTAAFLRSFDELVMETPTKDLSWDLVLDRSVSETADDASQYRVVQDPIFSIRTKE